MRTEDFYVPIWFGQAKPKGYVRYVETVKEDRGEKAVVKMRDIRRKL